MRKKFPCAGASSYFAKTLSVFLCPCSTIVYKAILFIRRSMRYFVSVKISSRLGRAALLLQLHNNPAKNFLTFVHIVPCKTE